MNSDSDSSSHVGDNDDDLAIFGAPSCDFVQPNDVDTLAAKDLAKLSISDREKVYHDIHGVSAEIKETPEFIRENLHLFGLKLPVCTTAESEAYHLALSTDPEYVRNPEFRLQFLRADRFEITSAVKRFLLHFTVKLDLFGPDLLVKNITQDDLDEETIWILNNRTGFPLPVRDTGGRMNLIKMSTPNERNVSILSVQRKAFYAGMVFAEDEESQRKGFVTIVYNVGQPLNWADLAFTRGSAGKWGDMMSALPLRIEAVHLCSDSILWRPMYAIFKFKSSLFHRVRVREHYGSHQEVLFQLQTFGIPIKYFPVVDGGLEAVQKLSADFWTSRRNLERMRIREKLKSSSRPDTASSEQRQFTMSVGTPTQDDVLLGRGKAFYSHPGNQRLRLLILQKVHLYNDVGYSGKKKLNSTVVEEVQLKNGRFLKHGGTGWWEVDVETARNKVGHLFRQIRQNKRLRT